MPQRTKKSKMKPFLKKKFLFLAGIPLILLIGLMIYILFDAFYAGNDFRAMQDPITSSESVDIRGLRELQASGGRAPRFADLQKKLSHVKLNKIIVDVKCEPHGYINGIPTNFLGYGLQSPGIRHLIRRLFWTQAINEKPELVIPEQEEAKKYSFGYKTVNIGSKFTAVDENIDEIVEFLDNIPKDVWVHVHCTNGRGRTSMIIAMLDILKNAPTVSLADIIKRQYLLGSVDLFNTVVWKRGTYNKGQLEARKKFIEDYYDFVVQRKAGGIQNWSEWNHQKRGSEIFS